MKLFELYKAVNAALSQNPDAEVLGYRGRGEEYDYEIDTTEYVTVGDKNFFVLHLGRVTE